VELVKIRDISLIEESYELIERGFIFSFRGKHGEVELCEEPSKSAVETESEIYSKDDSINWYFFCILISNWSSAYFLTA